MGRIEYVMELVVPVGIVKTGLCFGIAQQTGDHESLSQRNCFVRQVRLRRYLS